MDDTDNAIVVLTCGSPPHINVKPTCT